MGQRPRNPSRIFRVRTRARSMATLKLVTWNVNSARARLERIETFLAAHRPDVACLQEIKATEDTFPFEALRVLGYEAAIFGQPSYNGVAVVSRQPAADIACGLDKEARVIAATVFGVRLINVYVPNGGRVGSVKHEYKLRWLDALGDFLEGQQETYGDFVLLGDFNVAPNALDAAHPEAWQASVLCDPMARERLAGLVDRFGLVDLIRKHAAGPGVYTWWDYRTDGFRWNDGLRIDHILASGALADACAKRMGRCCRTRTGASFRSRTRPCQISEAGRQWASSHVGPYPTSTSTGTDRGSASDMACVTSLRTSSSSKCGTSKSSSSCTWSTGRVSSPPWSSS